jgi:hypothetical protein
VANNILFKKIIKVIKWMMMKHVPDAKVSELLTIAQHMNKGRCSNN